MKWISLFAASLGLAAAIGFAAPAEFSQLDSLNAELAKYAGTLKPDQRNRYGSDTAAALPAEVSRIAAELATGNYDYADQQLRQLAQMAPSPAVLGLVNDLLAATAAARAKRDLEAAARIDALVARTAQLCLHATTEKELDQLQVDLAQARLGVNRNAGGELAQRDWQKLDAAISVARSWQDYLAQYNAGNLTAAAQVMSQLANTSNYPIVPRSEILERARVRRESALTQMQPVIPTLDIKTLADVPEALEKLEHAAEGKSLVSVDNQEAMTQLAAIEAGVAAVDAGDLNAALKAVNGTFGNYRNNLQKNAPVFAELRRQLVLRIIPRYVPVPDDLAPHPDENPADYFMRLAKQAKAAGDWGLAARAYEAYGEICFAGTPGPVWLQNTRNALRSYLVGLNQERAGDIPAALGAYSSAMGMASTDIPVDDIARRVRALRKIRDDEIRKRQQADAEALQLRIKAVQQQENR